MAKKQRNNRSDVRQMRKQWRSLTHINGHSICASIVAAEVNGFPGERVALAQAQELKRGLNSRFGLRVRVYKKLDVKQPHYVFVPDAPPSRVRTNDDVLNCLLHYQILQASCEMVSVCAGLLPEMRKRLHEQKLSIDAEDMQNSLVAIWMKLMEGFLPVYRMLVQRVNQKDVMNTRLENNLSFLTEYVQCGLRRTVPVGQRAGALRGWAHAVRNSHPELTLDEAIKEELPVAVLQVFPTISLPTRFYVLTSRVDEHLKKLPPAQEADIAEYSDKDMHDLALFGQAEDAARKARLDAVAKGLTPRETDVFEMLRQTSDRDMIAKTLNIKRSTVDSICRHIFDKNKAQSAA